MVNIKNKLSEKKTLLSFNNKKSAKENRKEIKAEGSLGQRVLNGLQTFSKSLMFPIAILPAAALLNRFGALMSDTSLDGISKGNFIWSLGKIIGAPGQVAFDNIAAFFALGVGFGLTKDQRGEAALVAFLGYLGLTKLLSEGYLANMFYDSVLTESALGGKSSLLYILKEDDVTYQLDIGVLGGMTIGVITASLYNKYSGIKLPDSLAFFGGRRFVPMVAMAIVIPVGVIFAACWPWLQFSLTKMGDWVAIPGNDIAGTAVYAFVNRMTQPFGLHHIINTFLWFQLPITGEVLPGFENAGQEAMVNGDINAFQKGIIGSGNFQSGFFPMYMGGLPGVAAAMIMATPKGQKRKETLTFLGGVAFVAFLTGIDEPLVFAFIFVSPLLWVIHALLTSVFMMIVTAMDISLGFGFSAGLIDYLISIPTSLKMTEFGNAGAVLANPFWILALSGLAFVVWYFTFYSIIIKMNVPTVGRDGGAITPKITKIKSSTKIGNSGEKDKYVNMAEKIIEIIGNENIEEISNCATRLRLIVKNNKDKNIVEEKFKALGIFGVRKMGNKGLQLIVGVDVEHVANAMTDIHKKINIIKGEKKK